MSEIKLVKKTMEDFSKEQFENLITEHVTYKSLVEILQNKLQQKENIIKEVREYIEKNWISQKDADNYRFDDEELDIEISDIAVLFDILDKEVN